MSQPHMFCGVISTDEAGFCTETQLPNAVLCCNKDLIRQSIASLMNELHLVSVVDKGEYHSKVELWWLWIFFLCCLLRDVDDLPGSKAELCRRPR